MKKGIFSLLLLLCVLQTLHAQTKPGSLSGTLTDAGGQPVAYAVIKLDRQSDSVFVTGTASDNKGNFLISNIRPGRYNLKISCVGFDKLRKAVEVDGISPVSLGTVTLTSNNAMLKDVVIRSQVPPVEQKIDMTVVNVQGNIKAESNNALDIIKFAPAVTVSDNEDNISMSGKAGIDIYIDGKLTRLGGRSLTSFLKALPAGSVDQVEVISNPSAKYDVKGGRAILNIKTKKSQLVGFNGNVDASYSHAINNIYDISTNLNHRWNKFVLYGYFGYHRGTYQSRSMEDRELVGSGLNKILQINNKNIDNWKDPIARVGAEYYLTKNSSIGALIEAQSSTNGRDYTTDILNTNLTTRLDSVIRTVSSAPSKRTWSTYDLNYNYSNKKGTELAILADKSNFTHRIDNNVFNALISETPAKDLGGNNFNTHTDIDILTLRADLTRQFKNKYKLDAGFKISDVNTHNNFIVQDIYNGVSMLDQNQTNTFKYKEDVYALYANLGRSFKKFAYQIGLRAEQSDIKGVATDVSGNRTYQPDSSYINFLPSLYLSYFPSADHIFKLSYAKKITRPAYEDLAPFNYQLDLYTYHLGNPGLRVQSSSTVEFSYTFKNKVTFSTSYNHISDFFNPIFSQANGITFQQIINTGKEDDFFFNLDLPLTITSWWTMNNKGSVFHNSFKGQLYDAYLDVGKWAYTVYSSQRFKLPAKLVLLISGRYYSPSQKLIYAYHSYGSVAASIGRKLLNDKATVRFGFGDIFYNNKQRIDVNYSKLKYYQLNQEETRQMFLSFTYAFGNPKVKSTSQTSAGNSEEKRRANH